MSECDGIFDREGIPFENAFQDVAVRFIRSHPDLTTFEKKEYIICWFDVTYGIWNGSRFDLRDSRVKMSQWLTTNHYRTFEDYLQEDTTNAGN